MNHPGAALQKKTVLSRLRGGFSSYALARPKLAAFLCSFAVAALFIVPFILRQGGILYVSNDYVTQQIPLSQQIVQLLRGGNFVYDFEMDLGSSVIESYTWYNLGSVFSLLYLLFPSSATPYLLGPALILKFACGGLFAFLWLRLFTKSDLSALCGSLLYSFSGIAISNMVFPFADVYALFPLLPLGMEYLMRGEKHGFFAVAVALNVLVNPPLFFGAAVFMILYFLVKWVYRAFAVTLKSFARLAAEAVCGVALSGFLLLPFVASLAANPRVEGMLPFGKDWFVYVAYRYFEILRSLVLPAEVMHANSMMLPYDAVSPEGYLPLFGLVAVFAFVLHRGSHWVKGLLAASFGCMVVPILNSAFNAFNGTYYTRWLYMPVLVAALATALWLDSWQAAPAPAAPQKTEGISLRRGYVLWGLFAFLFALCMVLWCTYYGYGGFITYMPAFIANLAIGGAGLAVAAFAPRLWQTLPRLLACLVGLFCVACGIFNLTVNQIEAVKNFGELRAIPQNSIYAAETVPLPNGVFRINAPTSNTYFDHGSPFSFNSTVSPGIFELQAAFGRQRTSTSYIEYSEPGLWALLGVQYILVEPEAADVPLPNTSFYAEGTPWNVVENLDALPFVIGFDSYIQSADADGLDNTQKSIAMLHGLVLGEESASALGQSLSPIEAAALPQLAYQSGADARKAMAAGEVTLQNDGLTASITLKDAGAVLITLPYDKGWSCTINGEEVPLHKASYGLMAAACPAGESTIVLRYRPVGGTAGLALSALGLLGLSALIFLGRRAAKRRTAQPPVSPHQNQAR